MIPEFSIILPTYNRAYCIQTAIQSVINQIYPKWELIVIDDGSTDETPQIVSKIAKSDSRVKLIKAEHRGVSAARNVGLSHASNEWITFIDSDNSMRPEFLCVFVSAITHNKHSLSFYGALQKTQSKEVLHKPYSYTDLVQQNFIDLGVYVAHKQLFYENKFDETLTRLVDWDLILRQAKYHPPKFLDIIVLDYNDEDRKDRITVSADLVTNRSIIRKKQQDQPCNGRLAVVTCNFNTSKMTNDLLKSIDSRFTSRNFTFCVLDNSSREKFEICPGLKHNFCVFDNFQDKLLNFDLLQEKYSTVFIEHSQNASFKHTYSIQWLLDMCKASEFDEMLLFDSDTVLTKDIDFIDPEYVSIADVSTQQHYKNYGKVRLLPFIQYFNVKTISKLGLKFFDPSRLHGGLTTEKADANLYDTGASFYEDCKRLGLPMKPIDYRNYVTHFEHKSYK